jgi:hypothetical protein
MAVLSAIGSVAAHDRGSVAAHDRDGHDSWMSALHSHGFLSNSQKLFILFLNFFY